MNETAEISRQEAKKMEMLLFLSLRATMHTTISSLKESLVLWAADLKLGIEVTSMT